MDQRRWSNEFKESSLPCAGRIEVGREESGIAPPSVQPNSVGFAMVA